MILELENWSQTVSQLVSQSHMFYISGEKFIDKNISLSYWFAIDYCFLIQFSLVAQSCPTPCDPMNHSTPGPPVHHQLLEFTQTHFHQVGDAIQPSHPLPSPSPPAPNTSQHFNESTLRMRWPKYWSFSFSISPSNKHPGLISFRMDWLDPLAV